jgi:hypothetical protein
MQISERVGLVGSGVCLCAPYGGARGLDSKLDRVWLRLCCGADHSSIVQTMDTYSHLVPGMADDAAERFGGYLFGPN